MKNTVFYQECNQFTIEEAIELAKDSYLPWAHRLTSEITSLRQQLIDEKSKKPLYKQDY